MCPSWRSPRSAPLRCLRLFAFRLHTADRDPSLQGQAMMAISRTILWSASASVFMMLVNAVRGCVHLSGIPLQPALPLHALQSYRLQSLLTARLAHFTDLCCTCPVLIPDFTT